MMLDRRARVLLLALLVVAAFHAPAATAAPAPALQAAVLSWTDGDTARVALPAGAVTVRLVGIDTPETSRGERAARQGTQLGRDVATVVRLGRQAKAAAGRFAPPGARVRVETDVQSYDRYGRLLAYLWLADGRMVNEELVRAGYAMVLTIPPNVKYADRFLRAQQEARAARRGLWGGASTTRPRASGPATVSVPIGFAAAAAVPLVAATLALTSVSAVWQLTWFAPRVVRLWRVAISTVLAVSPLLLAAGMRSERPGALLHALLLYPIALVALRFPLVGVLALVMLLVGFWQPVPSLEGIGADVVHFIRAVAASPISVESLVFLVGAVVVFARVLVLRRALPRTPA